MCCFYPAKAPRLRICAIIFIPPSLYRGCRSGSPLALNHLACSSSTLTGGHVKTRRQGIKMLDCHTIKVWSCAACMLPCFVYWMHLDSLLQMQLMYCSLETCTRTYAEYKRVERSIFLLVIHDSCSSVCLALREHVGPAPRISSRHDVRSVFLVLSTPLTL